ncbi:hypothetical protein M0812_07807 [Anaeramoeba flamelloides]|uniref:Uncharacterized protein n=1 Tax=Anaeramoeba flamelloides TaxID=1746091 RepID=A0AAV8A373_9EUKA|nr:hypothetical protein M0812_07807 [Anaeramoeba flamelloides]
MTIFLKELQKFLVLLDIQPEPEQYRIIKEKISKKHGVLLQRGNPWLHLFNFKSKTYIESLSGNLDILIKLYPWVNVPLDPLGNKLNAIEVLDLSMILNIAIELTEYGYFESKIQDFEIEKIQIELDKQTDKRNLTQKEIKDENEKRYKKLFKNKRDQLILDIFREKNHLTLVNDFSNWKTEYFDQVPINNKKTNIHYLRHLSKCIRKNGSMFTFYLALERFHQNFKLKTRKLKLNGIKLLINLIENELLRKIYDISLLEIGNDIKNRKYIKRIAPDLLNFLKRILNLEDYETQDLISQTSIVVNKHIFKENCFVQTFDNKFYHIEKIIKRTHNTENEDSENNKEVFHILAQNIIQKSKIFTLNHEIILIKTNFQRLVNLIPLTIFFENCHNDYLLNKHFISHLPRFLDYGMDETNI